MGKNDTNFEAYVFHWHGLQFVHKVIEEYIRRIHTYRECQNETKKKAGNWLGNKAPRRHAEDIFLDILDIRYFLSFMT